MYTGWIDGDIDGSVALSGDAGFDGDGVGVLCAAWLAATASAPFQGWLACAVTPVISISNHVRPLCAT